jgi:hypothetical protein
MQGEAVFLLTELRDMRREVAELGERGLHGAVARETARAAPPPRELMG